nr:hypothetical protein [Vibrio sp. CyArs1]
MVKVVCRGSGLALLTP